MRQFFPAIRLTSVGFMKNSKFVFPLLFFLLLCITVHLAADPYDDLLIRKLSINPTLTGFFIEAMDITHQEIAAFNSPSLFFSDLRFSYGIQEDYLAGNFLVGGMLPLGNYLAVPVFIEVVYNLLGDTRNDGYSITTMGYMAGGGLVIYGRFGLLAGYIGYSFETIGESIWMQDTTSRDENRLQWAVFPIINAQEYPLLKHFVQSLDGFFSLDNLQMNRSEFKPTYKANILFRGITLIPYAPYLRMSLATYTQSNWYNYNAKYSLHAGKLDFYTIESEWSTSGTTDYKSLIIGFEVGYREFFDIRESPQQFEDGVFTRITLSYSLRGMMQTNSGIMVFMESSSRTFFNKPNFGFVFRFDFANEGQTDYLMSFGSIWDTAFRGNIYRQKQ